MTACPCASSLSRARRRLGAAPLHRLFEVLAGPVAPPSRRGSFYRRRRLVALDGTTQCLPDDPAQTGGTSRLRCWTTTGKVIRPQREPRSVRSGPHRHRHHAVTSTFTTLQDFGTAPALRLLQHGEQRTGYGRSRKHRRNPLPGAGLPPMLLPSPHHHSRLRQLRPSLRPQRRLREQRKSRPNGQREKAATHHAHAACTRKLVPRERP
ncbi:hypothetical protein [Streptomyces melanogenes]|uniref:hypothetical protein n=1 Tax=Streptomyces melanogenes TaxID=67326 RepID=UPI00357125A3